MSSNLAVAVSRADVSTVKGQFQRHTSPRVTTLTGSPYGGRWGPPQAFPVLYLGRPVASVTVEAYRHLVDGTEGMTGDKVAQRTLWTVNVDVSDVLDLREASSLIATGLTPTDLQSDVDDYQRCQDVALTAHQLGLRGIITPSAWGHGGETLALFTDQLTLHEMPTVIDQQVWAQLPADPRRLRSVPRSTTGT